jgi:hypothetical protein
MIGFFQLAILAGSYPDMAAYLKLSAKCDV